MTTKQIDCILELAQTQNFNRAAENLFISQPTITYQISNAENEIGFWIFDRSGKGASLTPAGEQFVISLRSIHEELKAAIEQGQNFSAKFREVIPCSLYTHNTDSRWSVMQFIRIIKDFYRQNPDFAV